MGFWDVFSITGTLVTKAVNFGSKVVKPILNGIASIANVVKDTANVLSMVPVVGAVASQVGAAANIISSVSSAGAEIIGVGERYVAKHAAPEPSEPSEPVVSVPPPIFEGPSTSMSTNASPGIVPFNATPAAPLFSVVPQSPFPTAAPLPAPIIPKSNVYPERRILRVRRRSVRERNRRYQKDNKYERDLQNILNLLDDDAPLPGSMKTGGLFGGSEFSGTGRKQASVWA